MYNRYIGNSGRVVRVEDSPPIERPRRIESAEPSYITRQAQELREPDEIIRAAQSRNESAHSAGKSHERDGHEPHSHRNPPPQPNPAPRPRHEPHSHHNPPSQPSHEHRRHEGHFSPPKMQGKPHGPLSEISGLLQKLSPNEMETADLILMLIMYLLYKESGDKDYLITMAAMMFL